MGQLRPLSLFSFFSSTNFTEKPVGFSRIQTRIVGVEDEYADHLTTTMAPSSGYFKWRRHCNNAFLSVNSEEIKAVLLFELKSKQVSKVFTLKLGHYWIYFIFWSLTATFFSIKVLDFSRISQARRQTH